MFHTSFCSQIRQQNGLLQDQQGSAGQNPHHGQATGKEALHYGGEEEVGKDYFKQECLLLCFMIKAGRGSSPFRPPYFTLSEVYIYKWANKYKKLV